MGGVISVGRTAAFKFNLAFYGLALLLQCWRNFDARHFLFLYFMLLITFLRLSFTDIDF